MHEYLKDCILLCVENKPMSIEKIQEHLTYMFNLHLDLAIEYLAHKNKIEVKDGIVTSLSKKE